MKSNTIDGVIAAAVEGAGVVSAPAWAVAGHLSEGRLRRILTPFDTGPRPIHAVFTHARLLSAKTRVMVDFLVQNMAAIDFDRSLRGR